jgi:anti-sigma regulatory factor (Ser/Thr protein kinase)
MRQLVKHLAPDPAAVPRMRRMTVAALTQWAVNTEAVEIAALVVSELVTNAVKVSRPEDEEIAVRLTLGTARVTVEVWSRPDATEIHPLLPADTSEGGRGLALVAALCSHWDIYPAESGGVVVYGQIAASPFPVQRGSDDAPLPTRGPQAVPDEQGAPGVSRWSTDPVVLARVAARLRAKWPWHEPPSEPSDDQALLPAGSARAGSRGEERTGSGRAAGADRRCPASDHKVPGRHDQCLGQGGCLRGTVRRCGRGAVLADGLASRPPAHAAPSGHVGGGTACREGGRYL